MGKAIRNLVLRLGDVAIPVALVATAREPDEKMFRVLHDKCKTPISLRVYCPIDERVLDPEQPDDATVTAWEVAPGQFLELADTELVALRPVDSSVIEIGGFVPAVDLDPLFVKKRYHLAPSKAWVGRRPYRALADAIADNQVVALTRFALWNSEQLGAISSRDGALELATLHFVDDVALQQRDEIAEQLSDAGVAPTEAEMMNQVVARFTRNLKPDDLASRQRPRVRELLEAKLAGQPIVEPEAAAVDEQPPPPPADLETALKRTLRGAPRRRRAPAARS